MRYINVFFTCSAAGCDAKDEMLVPARLHYDHSSGYGTAVVSSSTLPDGWGNIPKNHDTTRRSAKDRERTYCPAHCHKE